MLKLDESLLKYGYGYLHADPRKHAYHWKPMAMEKGDVAANWLEMIRHFDLMFLVRRR